MATRNARIGETRMMNCGMEATIIEYRKASDLDIKFEDGTIREHVYYNHFTNGKVSPVHRIRSDQSRVGETNTMSNGQRATIIAYRNAEDIDIEFDDGTVREHAKYDFFKVGKVSPVHRIRSDQSRVGESKVMNNGLVATIEAYRKNQDVDVVFEDGTKVTSVRYEHFQDGSIAHPGVRYNTSTSIQEFAVYYYLRNYGFRKVQRGEWKGRGFGKFELDLYNEAKRIAIEIDGGWHSKKIPAERELRKNQKCREFGIRLYRLRDESLQPPDDDWSINFTLDKQKTISTGLIDCKSEIVDILKENEIVFQDDEIDFYRDRDSILSEYYELYNDSHKKERIGQTNYSNPAKQMMTIVEYRAYTDLDVQFEDGSVRCNVSYCEFQKGSIQHPDKTLETITNQRLHERLRMKNGLMATVIVYNTAKNIDVQFEDGEIVRGVTYHSFKNRTIQHPNDVQNCQFISNTERVGETRQMNCGIYATIVEYKNSNNINVKFEDGLIRNGMRYDAFVKGQIAHKNRF